MSSNRVTVLADDMGCVIRVSQTNPEYGFIRLQQQRVQFTNGGWVKSTNVSTLLHGKVEDLESLNFQADQEIGGKIVIKEQTEPFNPNNPDRDLKYAGNTGVICCAYGEPIYRKTFFTTNIEEDDVLIAHTNGDAIREANGISTEQPATDSFNEVEEEEFTNEDVSEEVESETTFEL